VGQATDDEEFVEVVPMKLTEALEWIRDGRITEVKAVIGLLWAERFLGAI
jgi:ADP-ribose pyrophosphatase